MVPLDWTRILDNNPEVKQSGLCAVIAASPCLFGTEWVGSYLNCRGAVMLVILSGIEFQYFITVLAGVDGIEGFAVRCRD